MLVYLQAKKLSELTDAIKLNLSKRKGYILIGSYVGAAGMYFFREWNLYIIYF